MSTSEPKQSNATSVLPAAQAAQSQQVNDKSVQQPEETLRETEERLLGAIQRAKYGSHTEQKMEGLEMAKQIMLEQRPILLKTYCKMIVDLKSDEDPEIRKFIAAFIEDICRRSVLWIPQILDALLYLSHDNEPQVVARATAVTNNILRKAMAMGVKHPQTGRVLSMPLPPAILRMWSTCEKLRNYLFGLLHETHSTDENVRAAIVKLMETSIFANSYPSDESTARVQAAARTGTAAAQLTGPDVFTLADIPDGHQIFNKDDMQGFASHLVEILVDALFRPPSIPVVAGAPIPHGVWTHKTYADIINTLAWVACTRPQFLQTIGNAIVQFTYEPPSHMRSSKTSGLMLNIRLKSPLKVSLLKLLKLRALRRNPKYAELAKSVASCLADLGAASQAEKVLGRKVSGRLALEPTTMTTAESDKKSIREQIGLTGEETEQFQLGQNAYTLESYLNVPYDARVDAIFNNFSHLSDIAPPPPTEIISTAAESVIVGRLNASHDAVEQLSLLTPYDVSPPEGGTLLGAVMQMIEGSCEPSEEITHAKRPFNHDEVTELYRAVLEARTSRASNAEADALQPAILQRFGVNQNQQNGLTNASSALQAAFHAVGTGTDRLGNEIEILHEKSSIEPQNPSFTTSSSGQGGIPHDDVLAIVNALYSANKGMSPGVRPALAAAERAFTKAEEDVKNRISQQEAEEEPVKPVYSTVSDQEDSDIVITSITKDDYYAQTELKNKQTGTDQLATADKKQSVGKGQSATADKDQSDQQTIDKTSNDDQDIVMKMEQSNPKEQSSKQGKKLVPNIQEDEIQMESTVDTTKQIMTVLHDKVKSLYSKRMSKFSLQNAWSASDAAYTRLIASGKNDPIASGPIATRKHFSRLVASLATNPAGEVFKNWLNTICTQTEHTIPTISDSNFTTFINLFASSRANRFESLIEFIQKHVTKKPQFASQIALNTLYSESTFLSHLLALRCMVQEDTDQTMNDSNSLSRQRIIQGLIDVMEPHPTVASFTLNSINADLMTENVTDLSKLSPLRQLYHTISTTKQEQESEGCTSLYISVLDATTEALTTKLVARSDTVDRIRPALIHFVTNVPILSAHVLDCIVALAFVDDTVSHAMEILRTMLYEHPASRELVLLRALQLAHCTSAKPQRVAAIALVLKKAFHIDQLDAFIVQYARTCLSSLISTDPMPALEALDDEERSQHSQTQEDTTGVVHTPADLVITRTGTISSTQFKRLIRAARRMRSWHLPALDSAPIDANDATRRLQLSFVLCALRPQLFGDIVRVYAICTEQGEHTNAQEHVKRGCLAVQTAMHGEIKRLVHTLIQKQGLESFFDLIVNTPWLLVSNVHNEIRDIDQDKDESDTEQVVAPVIPDTSQLMPQYTENINALGLIERIIEFLAKDLSKEHTIAIPEQLGLFVMNKLFNAPQLKTGGQLRLIQPILSVLPSSHILAILPLIMSQPTTTLKTILHSLLHTPNSPSQLDSATLLAAMFTCDRPATPPHDQIETNHTVTNVEDLTQIPSTTTSMSHGSTKETSIMNSQTSMMSLQTSTSVDSDRFTSNMSETNTMASSSSSMGQTETTHEPMAPGTEEIPMAPGTEENTTNSGSDTTNNANATRDAEMPSDSGTTEPSHPLTNTTSSSSSTTTSVTKEKNTPSEPSTTHDVSLIYTDGCLPLLQKTLVENPLARWSPNLPLSTKQVKEATNLCFLDYKAFPVPSLVDSLEMMYQLDPLPRMILRAAMLTVKERKGAEAAKQAVARLLRRMIRRQVWDTPLWSGFIPCAKLTVPHSLVVICQLPTEQIQSIISRPNEAALKQRLRQWADQPANQEHVPDEVLDVLDIKLKINREELAKQRAEQAERARIAKEASERAQREAEERANAMKHLHQRMPLEHQPPNMMMQGGPPRGIPPRGIPPHMQNQWPRGMPRFPPPPHEMHPGMEGGGPPRFPPNYGAMPGRGPIPPRGHPLGPNGQFGGPGRGIPPTNHGMPPPHQQQLQQQQRTVSRPESQDDRDVRSGDRTDLDADRDRFNDKTSRSIRQDRRSISREQTSHSPNRSSDRHARDSRDSRRSSIMPREYSNERSFHRSPSREESFRGRRSRERNQNQDHIPEGPTKRTRKARSESTRRTSKRRRR